jgi:hypothetical protein
VRLALLPDGGPSGFFFYQKEMLPYFWMKIKHNNHDVENGYKILKIFWSMYFHPRQVKLKDDIV